MSRLFYPLSPRVILCGGHVEKHFLGNLRLMHIRAAKIIYGLDWYIPGQEVLALTKWNTIRTMFNRKLLSVRYNCYYGQSPVALQSLFTKSSPV